MRRVHGIKMFLHFLNSLLNFKDNNCLGDWDPDYECHELDEDKVLDLLEMKQKPGGLIIEHHVTDIFPERWFDIVFVLRTDNNNLYERSVIKFLSSNFQGMFSQNPSDYFFNMSVHLSVDHYSFFFLYHGEASDLYKSLYFCPFVIMQACPAIS